MLRTITQMSIKHLLFYFLLFILTTFSCKKEENIQVYEDLRVSGNMAPPFEGVTTLKVINYVNKLYIDLTGEEPTPSQLDIDVNYLESNDLSEASRQKIISDIMELERYHDRLYNLVSTSLINGIGVSQIEELIQEYEAIRDDSFLKKDSALGYFFENEIKKAQDLLNAKSDYKSGIITINEYYYRFVYNGVYDEINMGSENFVISCFENLFNRYPTLGEINNGVKMVDSEPAFILQKDGNSKTDFLDILLQNTEFYSGLVVNMYLSFLVRNPSSEELTDATILFAVNSDFQELQTTILKTDEYAGF